MRPCLNDKSHFCRRTTPSQLVQPPVWLLAFFSFIALYLVFIHMVLAPYNVTKNPVQACSGASDIVRPSWYQLSLGRWDSISSRRSRFLTFLEMSAASDSASLGKPDSGLQFLEGASFAPMIPTTRKLVKDLFAFEDPPSKIRARRITDADDADPYTRRNAISSWTAQKRPE
ncbi:hypothetical protein C8R45DRAFT_929591 [Mycena sanguinolenta]|nr:hypothetical protein C8R45DRAFT_929591 [Mycena sanguinolenta]